MGRLIPPLPTRRLRALRILAAKKLPPVRMTWLAGAMGWDIDDIREMSAPSGSTKTWIDRLLSTGAMAPEYACHLADALEAKEPGFVGVLFQLPYPVVLPPGWHEFPTSPDSVRADVKFELAELSMDNFGRWTLDPNWESQTSVLRKGRVISQGFAIFPVWGKRQGAHERYVANLDQAHRDPVIVSQRDSWIDNRPITMTGYEANFGVRLRKEVGHLLSRFLPAYALACRSEAPVQRWVYGCVPMLVPGRIIDVLAKPLATHWFEMPREGVPSPVPLVDLRTALRAPNRDFGPFELQLMAMERLRRDGEVALALIGTAALLEWFLNTAEKRTGKAAKTMAELLKSGDLAFLPEPLLALADDIRRARNALVHGPPPARSASHLPNEHSGREQADAGMATASTVRLYIEGAFEIFRTANLHASKSIGRPAS